MYKVNITQNLRRYNAPARGSKAWKTIYNRRTAVERAIGYLKEFFQLNNIRYRTGKRAKVHLDLVHLLYDGAKPACDRLTERLR
ncbi:mobile element protein [Geomicrobium sp. JCM 19037]|nr:mobile element protein [Geomicrobium sp. JCM 19037]